MIAAVLGPSAGAHAAGGDVSEEEPSDEQVLSFRLCESEAFLALHMGRNYMVLSRRDRSSVLDDVSRDDTFTRGLAEALLARVDDGTVRHYADFAADRLAACADRQNMEFSKPKDLVRLCFARVDIPFFLMAFRAQGLPREEALQQVKALLKDRDHFPDALIDFVATELFGPGDQEPEDRYMRKVFWTCVFSQEWAAPAR